MGAFNVLLAWTGEVRNGLYERTWASAGIPLVEP